MAFWWRMSNAFGHTAREKGVWRCGMSGTLSDTIDRSRSPTHTIEFTPNMVRSASGGLLAQRWWFEQMTIIWCSSFFLKKKTSMVSCCWWDLYNPLALLMSHVTWPIDSNSIAFSHPSSTVISCPPFPPNRSSLPFHHRWRFGKNSSGLNINLYFHRFACFSSAMPFQQSLNIIPFYFSCYSASIETSNNIYRCHPHRYRQPTPSFVEPIGLIRNYMPLAVFLCARSCYLKTGIACVCVFWLI